MKCIILAGGFATRLWPLTEKTAKPLILLAGKPMIAYIIESLPKEMEIIVSTNAVFADDFNDWRQKNYPNRNIEIFVEDSENEEGKKGALFATALVIQKKNIAENVLLIAGDNYFGFSLQDFLTDFHAHPECPLLAAYDIGGKEKAKSFGVVVPEGQELEIESREHKKIKTPNSELQAPRFIRSFQEKPDAPLSTLVSTGCFAFPKSTLAEIVHFAETSRDDLGKIFEYFLTKEQKVRFYSFQEKWFDVGSFTAYLEANRVLINEQTLTEENVKIAADSNISGSVFLGKNVKISKNVVLENTIVLEGSTLENCEIRNSVIGKNVFISDLDLNQKIIRDESFLTR